MRTHGITIYNGIVTGFREFLVNLKEEDYFDQMRIVTLVGEAMTREDVSLFDRHFPRSCTLKHYYGATEQIQITEFTIDRESLPDDRSAVPIGYPVNGVQVELVDDRLQPVPDGEVGEIAVRSRFLSPGYLADPARTARTWIGTGARRMYLTGDVARAGKDGCLFHLGRKDEQIKVRGHRILPSQIENVVVQHPLIQQAVVTRFDEAGDPKLACYYVAEQGQDPGQREVRQFLASRLAGYMMPNVFLAMESLPLTHSGKVQRKALPKPWFAQGGWDFWPIRRPGFGTGIEADESLVRRPENYPLWYLR